MQTTIMHKKYIYCMHNMNNCGEYNDVFCNRQYQLIDCGENFTINMHERFKLVHLFSVTLLSLPWDVLLKLV